MYESAKGQDSEPGNPNSNKILAKYIRSKGKVCRGWNTNKETPHVMRTETQRYRWRSSLRKRGSYVFDLGKKRNKRSWRRSLRVLVVCISSGKWEAEALREGGALGLARGLKSYLT